MGGGNGDMREFLGPFAVAVPKRTSPKRVSPMEFITRQRLATFFVNRLARCGVRDSVGLENEELHYLECDGLLLPLFAAVVS